MKYNFESIAGYETEKEELKRLCSIFNNREKYEKKGAKLPKGIIFYGEAGTGKTLFAKVMANECNLRVFKIDLGDVENESAICRHIKKTFIKAAKQKGPSMIFFDEADKVLPNDEEEYYTDRSKTILTQLLTLIDGMDSAGNIVFVATCNNYDNLPKTLTRPGRLDKKIGLGLPTFSSRVAVLDMYIKKSTCRFEMLPQEIARLCGGFSCAAIQTLINECILQSNEDGFVSEDLLRERFFEIKNEDITRVRSTMDDTVRACRNIGAFIVAKSFNVGEYLLSLDEDSVCCEHFNNILSYFDDDYDEEDEDEEYDDDYDEEDEEEECDEETELAAKYYSKTELLNCITVLMGGYVAEELVLHKIYDNVSTYFSLMDDILLSMASNGMFGVHMYYAQDRNEQLPYSASRLEKLNCLFDEIMQQAYEQAKTILSKNEELLKKFIPLLVEQQVLQGEELEWVLQENGGIKV